MNVLIIYDNKSTHVKTIYESLLSLNTLKFKVKYANATSGVECKYDLNKHVDVVLIHYSIRLSLGDHLSQSWAEALEKFLGPILSFIQDEFDTTHHARKWLNRLPVKKVYSLIPEPYHETVYPGQTKDIEFEQVLAGYIPDSLLNKASLKPMNRKIHIGYRGRDLPFWYGKFGQEKAIIGEYMKAYSERKNISHDIEWLSSQRIYNTDWYTFLANINFMLGTEGGSNVLDEFGNIRKSIEETLALNPTISFNEVFDLHLVQHENRIITNQLTPKVFEAASSMTGLILFEGKYNGIIQPNQHYLELKKDFSNVDEVLELSYDTPKMIQMIERTYEEVVKNPIYHSSFFINKIEKDIQRLFKNSHKRAKWLSLFNKVGSDEIEIYYKDKA